MQLQVLRKDRSIKQNFVLQQHLSGAYETHTYNENDTSASPEQLDINPHQIQHTNQYTRIAGILPVVQHSGGPLSSHLTVPYQA